MMTLIIGGSGSGKSAYAENYMMSVSKEGQKYYIATMRVFDAEGMKKIKRHKELRAGKGFITLEQSIDIESASKRMKKGEKSALLECISNLTANEMFQGEIQKSEKSVTEKILKGIAELNKEVKQLIIVSNNVFEDGKVYDSGTMEYIQAMGKINEQLANMADEVVEVVVGIPLVIKSEGKL